MDDELRAKPLRNSVPIVDGNENKLVTKPILVAI